MVDLENSGVGIDGRQFQTLVPTDESPVVIMFFPGGGVERVVVGGISVSPTSTIHLLIGRFEGLERADNTPESPNGIAMSAGDGRTVSYNKNLADLETVWISIGHRTGVISSSQNAWLLSPPPGGDTGPFFQNSLRNAREFAQTAQTLGGR